MRCSLVPSQRAVKYNQQTARHTIICHLCILSAHRAIHAPSRLLRFVKWSKSDNLYMLAVATRVAVLPA
jgi:hypothetical protein